MAITSNADLVASVLRYELLEPEQIDELVGDLQARFPAPPALADELVRRGWLSPYQVLQLSENQGERLLVGQYLLIDRIGAGGMGEVFKARHRQLGRVVALKVLRKERGAQAVAVARFQREIRAVAKLSHPNVVRAYDAGEVGGQLFYTMEFVEGANLFQQVKRSGPLPVGLACEYARQAALGLQHAYESGVVHRDVKPSNLLVSPDGFVKILDMGLATLQESPTAAGGRVLTRLKVVGTPDYIAPEQARDSHAVDIRSDLYSLGCTLYYLLAGRPPFAGGKTPQEKMLQHQHEEHVPIETVRPEVPPGVRAVLRRLITRDVRARFQTPAELAAALEPFARRVAVTARTGTAGETVPVAPEAFADPSEPTRDDAWHFSTAEMAPPRRPRAGAAARRMAPVLALAVAAGIALGVVALGVVVWAVVGGPR